jgi:aryl-alcohol dehydrogenase-like predicted oxidoreductase
MPYGITSAGQMVPEDEVRRILRLAAQHDIQFLDTAQAYGSSERVLGRCWPTGAKRRLISKLPAQTPPESWEPAIQASLNRLNTEYLDGFILHRPADLSGPHASLLLDWLESLRERELVKRIGVSIYDSSDLNGLPLDRLQLVQLPLSLYDQRLLRDGTVAQLQDAGLAVHGRSLFLQGLLVQPEDQWPEFLSSAFRAHHRELTRHLECLGMSLLEGAVAFAASCKNLEAVLFGVKSSKELNELLSAWKQGGILEMEPVSTWAWNNRYDLDPRFWLTR